MSQKFYLTTSIAYVNAAPHVGFAMELAQADALARYHRLCGDPTFFSTGTDEHGIKIFNTAAEKGLSAQELVDGNAAKFKDLAERMNLSHDGFIRTTSSEHKSAVPKLWMKMLEKGDIYKGTYEGIYCVGCESYISEKDLIDGLCPAHQKPPIKLSEENYFFRLSAYSDAIRKAIESDAVRVVPESRKNEMLNIIGEGLQDVSFSRPKNSLPWGISVPNDPDQVMYVWCDALSNYLTVLGVENNSEQFQQFWPADVHLIGKDILRFHAGIWLGMLLSLDFALPKQIYVHGYITSEGQKMSKSLGNVVDPIEYIDQYGTDPLRYYLLREIPTTDDGDFSKERFVALYNSELGNSLGNLVSRVFAMTEKYFSSAVPQRVGEYPAFEATVTDTWKQYHAAVANFDLKRALEVVWDLVSFQNKFVDDMKPWALAKTDVEKLKGVLYYLLEGIRHVALMIQPFIPETSAKILDQYGMDAYGMDFGKDSQFGQLETGKALTKAPVLFPRVETQPHA